MDKLIILLLLIAFSPWGRVCAGVPRFLVEGTVYFAGDSTLDIRGERRMAIPRGRKSVEIVDCAYTRQARVCRKIEAGALDSVTVWIPTAPERRHRVANLPDYGWCLHLGGDEQLSVLAYCKKGYRVAGNGGIWCRGKFVVLIKTPDGIKCYDNPGKMANGKFREEVAAYAAHDSALRQLILDSRTTRLKTIRMLELLSSTDNK